MRREPLRVRQQHFLVAGLDQHRRQAAQVDVERAARRGRAGAVIPAQPLLEPARIIGSSLRRVASVSPPSDASVTGEISSSAAGAGSPRSRNAIASAPLAVAVPRIAGVEPMFGARLNSLAFERTYLDRPLPHANPITVSMCEQMCSRLLEARRAHVGTAAMIRDYLGSTPGAPPFSLEDMARLMNTSARTLKRRLQDEGTTFRALLAESRGAMAEALLGDERLTLTEVAERLGFGDLSSFSQAFKRWYGMAPGVFRKSRDVR